MERTAEDLVFKALADPTRRAILDVLFDSDGQSVGEIAAHFPEMTRFGVMKHLRVLEEANLVVALASGRSTLHYLNPVPIAQLAHRWVSRYAAPFAGALIDLEHQVAADQGATGPDRHPPERHPPDRHPPERHPPDRHPPERHRPDRQPPTRPRS